MDSIQPFPYSNNSREKPYCFHCAATSKKRSSSSAKQGRIFSPLERHAQNTRPLSPRSQLVAAESRCRPSDSRPLPRTAQAPPFLASALPTAEGPPLPRRVFRAPSTRFRNACQVLNTPEGSATCARVTKTSQNIRQVKVNSAQRVGETRWRTSRGGRRGRSNMLRASYSKAGVG